MFDLWVYRKFLIDLLKNYQHELSWRVAVQDGEIIHAECSTAFFNALAKASRDNPELFK